MVKKSAWGGGECELGEVDIARVNIRRGELGGSGEGERIGESDDGREMGIGEG